MRRLLGVVLAAFIFCGAGREIRFTDKVLPGTRFVKDPEAALGEPDGKCAGIELHNGALELALKVKNEAGYDLAVHAQRPQYGFLPETVNYVVFAKANEAQNWTFLGWGTGKQSPEYFEMGDLPTADRIMILFKDIYDIFRIVGIYRLHSQPYLMNIDAVAALH